MKHLTLFSQCVGLLFLTLLTIGACDRAIQPQEPARKSGARIQFNQTITQVVVNSPNFSLLEAAVIKAGLADALASGNLTVFAPTDAAFQAAGFANADAINNADVNALRNILLYHVIGTERFFEDRISENLTGFTTLQGQEVFATRLGGLSVNGVPVSQADLNTNNGVIHVIDKVLLPPAGNTVEVAVANPNLTYLVAAVQRASQGEINVLQILLSERFTVFAPTNAAFMAAGFPTIESIRAVDPNVLGRILRYHIVRSRFFSSQLSEGSLTSIQGNALATTKTPAKATVKGLGNSSPASVLLSDIVTTNGVVHVIDQVLLPDGGTITTSITDIVVANPAFSLLEAAVIKAGLAGALATGNLTVFAPTDAAFQAAGFANTDAINNADVNVLRNILLYHVVGNRFPTQILSTNVTGYKTLQGDEVFVAKRQNISVNGIFVEQANIQATNGVIHVINKVLIPPTGNLAEVAAANPNLTYLVAALQRAGLVQTVASAGALTVFAPTNSAFQAAGFPTIEAVRAADPDVLARILTYHVVAGRELSSTLRSGQVTTLRGLDVLVAVGPNQAITVKGNGNATPSNVVIGDVITRNGIVHVINQVLLP
ncbi:fasciclin domain-containing protein [Spirosoma fluviale]|uniref:Transforming growth factor-beta-induced protein n=1 Tax=Spirosoma fluviale TaxID=1597977 RepID=A0A286GL22_9BACT|nr:fasciclin domain-containing protein [Spirosoma fluviale]SOD96202.1 transforming growth factor-beta-induced protein [Spirosoma fluviale]